MVVLSQTWAVVVVFRENGQSNNFSCFWSLKGDNPLIVTRLLRNAYLHHLRIFYLKLSALIAVMHRFPCRKSELHQVRFNMHFSENQLGRSTPVIAHFCYMFHSKQEIPELNQLHTYKHNGQDECLCLILGCIFVKIVDKRMDQIESFVRYKFSSLFHPTKDQYLQPKVKN